SVTYRELSALAGGVAKALETVPPGGRVAVALPSGVAALGAFWGAVLSGRVPVMLNLLLEPERLADFLRKVRAVVVLSSRTLSMPLGDLRRIEMEDVFLAPLPPPSGVSPQAPAAILLTSGTTGVTKGVPLSHSNLLSNVDASLAATGFGSNDVILGLIPLFHSFGLLGSGLMPILCGAQTVLVERFSPLAVAKALMRHQPTTLFAVPAMFRALVRGGERPKGSERLRLCVSGGEPLERTLESRFQEIFGTPLLNGYGLTETSPVVTLNPPSASRAGTVGRPLPGVRIRLGDPIETAEGTSGEVQIRGPNVMTGYFEDPAATKAAFTEDGWFRSGDIGAIDADGYLRITGRLKDLIISGGENILPGEIEAVLEGHPAVGLVAVVGAADSMRGEVPIAFVVLREGAAAAPEEILGYARQRLLRHRVPREIRIVSELPSGPTGKVLKRVLRERLALETGKG
ncbi:MAG: AMP-binding protein, partial [Planctomycetota bacterium]